MNDYPTPLGGTCPIRATAGADLGASLAVNSPDPQRDFGRAIAYASRK
jgi:hypothetical protein